jgi:O-antigen/teichoic acid export membrane protein
MSTARSLQRPLAWAFAMNWGQRGLTTVFTFVLAAMLGPRDFGVVAMAIVYVTFIDGFVEQGLGTAIIQRKDIDKEHLDSAFWLNLAWSLVFVGITFLTAGWWARANDLPELENVIKALSPTIVLASLTIVQFSLLQRRMDFKSLAVRANAAALAGGGAGIALALAGFGVWALVAQQLTAHVVSLVLFWALVRWAPRLRFSRAHSRDLLSFSVHVFVANIGGFLNRRADALLMGLFFGPVVVGIYRLADRLVDVVLELTMRPVGAISLPHFSRLQADPEALRQGVRSCMRVAVLATVPAMLVIAACSDYVLAVFGEEWEPGGVALKLLAIVGIAKALVFFSGPLLFALARPGFRALMLWVLAGASAATVVLVAMPLQGEPESDQLLGMAASRAVLFVLVVIPVNLAIIARLTGLTFKQLLHGTPVPLVAGLLAVGAVAGLQALGLLDRVPPIPALIITLGLATAITLGVLLLLDGSARRATRDTVQAFAHKLRRARTNAHASST